MAAKLFAVNAARIGPFFAKHLSCCNEGYYWAGWIVAAVVLRFTGSRPFPTCRSCQISIPSAGCWHCSRALCWPLTSYTGAVREQGLASIERLSRKESATTQPSNSLATAVGGAGANRAAQSSCHSRAVRGFHIQQSRWCVGYFSTSAKPQH